MLKRFQHLERSLTACDAFILNISLSQKQTLKLYKLFSQSQQELESYLLYQHLSHARFGHRIIVRLTNEETAENILSLYIATISWILRTTAEMPHFRKGN